MCVRERERERGRERGREGEREREFIRTALHQLKRTFATAPSLSRSQNKTVNPEAAREKAIKMSLYLIFHNFK